MVLRDCERYAHRSIGKAGYTYGLLSAANDNEYSDISTAKCMSRPFAIHVINNGKTAMNAAIALAIDESARTERHYGESEFGGRLLFTRSVRCDARLDIEPAPSSQSDDHRNIDQYDEYCKSSCNALVLRIATTRHSETAGRRIS